jgi:hypothetical protein
MNRKITAAIAALALGAVGCGGQPQTAAEAAADATNSFLSNVNAERWDEACDALTQDARLAFMDLEAGLGTQGCPATMERVVSAFDRADRDALATTTIGSGVVDVEPGGRTATVLSPLGGELLLERKGEHWLVDWNAAGAAQAVAEHVDDTYGESIYDDPEYNSEVADTDGDGIEDLNDPDLDGDGVPFADDADDTDAGI